LATSRARRNSDIKLLVSATVGVLMAGFLIAGAILVATRGSKSTVCPEINAGLASEVRRTVQTGASTLQTVGSTSCSFYFALEDNDIVAYRLEQPDGCRAEPKADHWVCGGVRVEAEDLAEYPVSIRRFDDVDAVFVDLRPPEARASTTTVAG
jgi:hypothetical protein